MSQKLLGEELPSMPVNRFQVQASQLAVRVAFAEQVPGGSGVEQPRAVILLSPSDAAELATLLQRMAKELAEKAAQERKKAN